MISNEFLQEAVALGSSSLKQLGTEMPMLKSRVLILYFHTSSTNGVFLRFPLAAMVFLPSTNFFAA